MKKITTTLLIFISFYSCAQDFSTINFIGRGEAGNSYAIYINQHLIGTVHGKELLVYKIYSEGYMSVITVWESNNTKASLDIKHGNTYYFECYGTQDRSIGAGKAKALLKENKSTITGEEEKANPLSKIASIDNDFSKQGTCFLINRKGYLITNYHIVNNAKTVQVKGIGGDFSTLYGVDVVSFDADLDLALLKIKNPTISFDSIPYKLSSETNEVGAKSFVLGYPLTANMGENIKATEGVISAKNGYKGSISYYQFSTGIEPGNSGSPLFNDKGDVIGLMNAKLEGATGTGCAVKSQYIQAFLMSTDNVQSDMSVSTTANLTLADKTAKLKNYIFIVEGK